MPRIFLALPLVVGMLFCQDAGAAQRKFKRSIAKAPSAAPVPAPVLADSPELHPLACFIRDIRPGGIDTVFIAENHDSEQIGPVVSHVLSGACASGPFVFQRELTIPGSEADFDAMLKSRPFAIRAMELVLHDRVDKLKIAQLPHTPVFEQALLHTNATALKWFHFTSAGHRSMTGFLDVQGMRVASVGLAHAEFLPYSSLGWLLPGGGLFATTDLYMGFPSDALADMVAGFSRSYAAGRPAILIRLSDVWSIPPLQGRKTRFAAHYASLGFASFDWVLDRTFNMSFVVRWDFLPWVVKALSARPKSELFWWCDGMAGCPATEQDRDEL